MALTVNYKVSPSAVLATLYRSTGSKIDLTNLPLDKIVLDKAKTEHVFADGINNTHYSFVIETTDLNGRKNYSAIQDIFYKTELGPGPNKVTRGYFDFGVFGEVTSEELGITPDALRDYIANIAGNTPPLSGVKTGGDVWMKCLVNKRIIYIPKDRYFYMGASGSYDANTLYATRLCDSNGLVDNCPTISIKGCEYKYRGLCHHDTDLTGAAALTAIKDIVITNNKKARSEINMYACLAACTNGLAGGDKEGLGLPADPTATQLPNIPPFRAGFFNPLDGNVEIKVYGLGTHAWPNAGTGCCVYLTSNPYLITQGVANYSPYLVGMVPVLELLD